MPPLIPRFSSWSRNFRRLSVGQGLPVRFGRSLAFMRLAIAAYPRREQQVVTQVNWGDSVLGLAFPWHVARQLMSRPFDKQMFIVG